MKDEWGKSFEQGDIFRSGVAYRHCGRDATWTGPEMMGDNLHRYYYQMSRCFVRATYPGHYCFCRASCERGSRNEKSSAARSPIDIVGDG